MQQGEAGRGRKGGRVVIKGRAEDHRQSSLIELLLLWRAGCMQMAQSLVASCSSCQQAAGSGGCQRRALVGAAPYLGGHCGALVSITRSPGS